MESKDLYCLFKKIRSDSEIGRDYLFVCNSESPSKYFDRIIYDLKSAGAVSPDIEILSQGKIENIVNFRDRFGHELNLLHSHANRLTKMRNNRKPFDNVYDVACYFFINNAFFSLPVDSGYRPEPIDSNDPLIISVANFNVTNISPPSERTRVIRNIYRGLSSDKYNNLSALIRSDSLNNRASKLAISLRTDRCERFRKYLREHFGDYQKIFHGNKFSTNEVKSLEYAFMQHFKAEASLSPPLIDFTYDPLVALYFASFNPSDGEVGVINRLSAANYIAHMHVFSSIGRLNLIYLPSVNRLRNQRALLLEGPESDIVDQLMPFKVYFRQRAGVRFEDVQLGICDNTLLNSDENIIRFCKEFDAVDSTNAESVSTANGYSNTKLLEEDISHYASLQHVFVPSDAFKINVKKLVHFHVSMETCGDISAGAYSVRTLLKAVDRIIAGDCFEQATFDAYINNGQADENEKIKMLKIRSRVSNVSTIEV